MAVHRLKATKPVSTATAQVSKNAQDSKAVLSSKRSNEIFLAVVGPVGAGTTRVADVIGRLCGARSFSCERIKASQLIGTSSSIQKAPRKTLESVVELQNAGDAMRAGDKAAVAKAIIKEIAGRRAKSIGIEYTEGQPVQPDDQKRAFIIDSIRHPAEVHLLRRTYGAAFALVGVVCEDSIRRKRILSKYFTVPEQDEQQNIDAVKEFIARDYDDVKHPHGQHVADAFYESDLFVDNTQGDKNDRNHLLDTELQRLINIISHSKIERPTVHETAMHHAYSARARSACLSRQVGAALVAADGTIIATGTNEAPAAGGGVYGEGFSEEPLHDGRCAFLNGYCSNNREQTDIINDLINDIAELKEVVDRNDLSRRLRRTRIGGLTEFSRAVHAEMDAILSAARQGNSTVGTRLYVTTFPCHYCAKHIVASGVFEAQYIEPYPKSLALKLHEDAIEVDRKKWREQRKRSAEASPTPAAEPTVAPGSPKILFSPFVGVAPRLYSRAFEKTFSLKDKETGDMKFGQPEWGGEWQSLTVGYPELEALLVQ